MRLPAPVQIVRSSLVWGLMCAGTVLAIVVAGSAPAQAPTPRIFTKLPIIPVGREPITPIPAPPAADPAKVALGERLFRDPRLSRDGRRTCASCHDTSTNGAGADKRDAGLDGKPLTYNTSTVFNAALSFRVGWSGTYRTLESAAMAILQDPRVMGSTAAEAVARLSQNHATVREFRRVYGRDPDAAALLDALATYERSLLTPGSRFDRWLEGDSQALTSKEKHGYELFKSFGCVSCHQGVNVGGNLFETRGTFGAPHHRPRELLRVPSLRNIAATPPYFHDGSAATLHDAVRRMGRAQLDRTLSDGQIDAIVAFLNTLTGTYQGREVRKPP